MHSSRSILIVGNSHTDCIQAVVNRQPDLTNVRVVNPARITKPRMSARVKVRKVVKAARRFRPDAICLVVMGNSHNMLGIVENPVKFSVGMEGCGSAPINSEDRHFIPSALMEDHLNFMYARFKSFEIIQRLYDAYPKAKRLYLNSPPPIGDFDHLQRTPGIFEDKLHLGQPPSELRMQLYRIQTKILRKVAQNHNAIFLEPPPEVLDDKGFLASPYHHKDPTHANARYGEIMLCKMFETMDDNK